MEIEVVLLSKSFKEVQALKNICFSVASGELFGVIGPDGAGKTTLFRLLATLLKPDEGYIRVRGLDTVLDYRAIRNGIGYMPGKFSLYQDLSIEENLHFFADVFGADMKKNYELIAPIYRQIAPFKDRRAGALSGGMKQKLALCCALIHRPSVLLLDEPGTGVDPVSRKEFWEMLALLKKQGLTILVSTPNMDEAALCDRVALLQQGRVVAIDRPSAIIERYPYPLFAVRSKEMHRLIMDLREWEPVQGCYGFGEYAHLSLHTASRHPSEIAAYLEQCGHEAVEIKSIAPGIEDCYIAFEQQA
jgi:ABC-type multidrug transport system ATPase subunit